jgi:type IV secretion system protein VirB6
MFESILKAGDASVERFIFGSWQQFNTASGPWLTSLLVIFVALVGYLLWIGRIEISLSELFPRFFKMIFIFVLVTRVDLLDRLVYRTVTDVPGAVATTMVQSVGQTSGDINASVDDVYARGMRSGLLLAQKGGLTNFTAYLFAGWIWLVTTLGILPVVFALLLAKLAVGVLLGFAPFALVLYLFDATRSLFQGYLRQLLGFALIPVMIYSLLALVLSLVNLVSEPLMTAATNDAIKLTFIAPYSLVMLAVGLLATQVVSWSGGIAGALALSAAGAFSRPSTAFSGGLQLVQSGLRAAAGASAQSRVVRAAVKTAAFAGGVLRQGTGVRPPRLIDPFFRGRQ